jgi:hypothetical protein
MQRKNEKKLVFSDFFLLIAAYQANIKYCIRQVLFSLKNLVQKKMRLRHSDNSGGSF